jgi:hypothetical protein
MVQQGNTSIWGLNPSVVGSPFAGTWSFVLKGIVSGNTSGAIILLQLDHIGLDTTLFESSDLTGIKFYTVAPDATMGIPWTTNLYDQAGIPSLLANGFYLVASRDAAGIVRVKVYDYSGVLKGDWRTNNAFTYTRNKQLFTIYSDRTTPITWSKGTLFSGSPNLTWQDFSTLP